MTTEAEFERLLACERVALETLQALFDRLRPIEDTGFMHGEWDGGCFRTGHPGEQQLVSLGWVGKRFHGDDDVDPIVTRDAGGVRVASPVLGKASLRLMVYRGAPTATMIYDRHPIFDHFREISDTLVLGVMDRKGDGSPLYFYLRRLPPHEPQERATLF